MPTPEQQHQINMLDPEYRKRQEETLNFNKEAPKTAESIEMAKKAAEWKDPAPVQDSQVVSEINYDSEEWKELKWDLGQIFQQHIAFSKSGAIEGNPAIHRMAEYAWKYRRLNFDLQSHPHPQQVVSHAPAEWVTEGEDITQEWVDEYVIMRDHCKALAVALRHMLWMSDKWGKEWFDSETWAKKSDAAQALDNYRQLTKTDSAALQSIPAPVTGNGEEKVVHDTENPVWLRGYHRGIEEAQSKAGESKELSGIRWTDQDMIEFANLCRSQFYTDRSSESLFNEKYLTNDK